MAAPEEKKKILVYSMTGFRSIECDSLNVNMVVEITPEAQERVRIDALRYGWSEDEMLIWLLKVPGAADAEKEKRW